MSCADIAYFKKNLKKNEKFVVGGWKEARSREIDLFDQLGQCNASCEVKPAWQSLRMDYDLCSDRVGLPYVFLLEDMSSFLIKTNLSSEDAKKWPNVLLFNIMNSENMSNHSSTKNFGKFQRKQRPADVMTFYFFLVITCFWAEKWTFADIMTFFLVFSCFWAEKWTDMCGHDDPQRTSPPFE